MTTDETPMTLADALADLTQDGDTIEMGDGRTLRLRIEQDECQVSDLWPDDCYGAVAYAENSPSGYRDYPRDRPEGFDGNAEKLHVGRGYDAWWWQPPADIRRGTDTFTMQRRLVSDLLEYGFYSVGIELLDGTDAYRRPIVANAAWLGGIEPNPSASYLAEVISDLVAELEIDNA